VASLAAGVLPVLQARRLDLARALSDGTLASAGSGRGRLAMARLGIVASQVAVTSVLVIGAVLLTRSFMARMAADRGYDPANVLTASVPFPTSYSFEQRQQARGRILERLRERPGITHAAFSSGVPLISSGGFASFDFVTPLKKTPIQAETMRRLVTPDYFGALGMRLRAGRALSDADALGAPTAVVVNRRSSRRSASRSARRRCAALNPTARPPSSVSSTICGRTRWTRPSSRRCSSTWPSSANPRSARIQS
jgi:hypothetical protein